uniref:Uncharacterized protein n=1 Tax=Callorhinchus milii TaxID=7868 RepID=A0A4W3H4Z0_CALMI
MGERAGGVGVDQGYGGESGGKSGGVGLIRAMGRERGVGLIWKPFSKSSTDTMVSNGYDSLRLDATSPSYMWTSTLPAAGSALSVTEYHNNLSHNGSLLSNGAHSSLSGMCVIPRPCAHCVYIQQYCTHSLGVQKNLVSHSMVTSSSLASTGTSTGMGTGMGTAMGTGTGTSGQCMVRSLDDILKKDYKFLLLEKETSPKKDAELLIMSKDSGKLFTTSSNAMLEDNTLKKEKLVTSGTDHFTNTSASGKRGIHTAPPVCV